MLERGTKQGDPIAALLFILAVEILCIRLREDPQIEHYEIGSGDLLLLSNL